MFYLDASAAMAAVTKGGHSEAMRWLGEHAAEPILCSGWTVTEVASARVMSYSALQLGIPVEQP
ncbi:MAG: hypothetical protein J7500_11015 [Sphingomonas sp.]|uniref:hypothetical protein n=1 Tax=Sphingomonas sp. TaxID=28214 RepID=UPI001B2BD4FB|nr:hypothetical protein [Sphingomonas sp.]MBO9623229.1 hypothetical protein [Sphingomonas sp.]